MAHNCSLPMANILISCVTAPRIRDNVYKMSGTPQYMTFITVTPGKLVNQSIQSEKRRELRKNSATKKKGWLQIDVRGTPGGTGTQQLRGKGSQRGSGQSGRIPEKLGK